MYVFWDAYYKDLLFDADLRSERMASDNNRLPLDRRYELRLRSWFDSIFYFQDFWNWVSYQFFFSSWTPNASDAGHRFFAPKRVYADPNMMEELPPRDQRYSSVVSEHEMRLIRRRLEWGCDFDRGVVSVKETVHLKELSKIEAYLHPRLRKRSLAVLIPESPFYFKQLSVEEKLCYELIRSRQEKNLLSLGVHVLNLPLDSFSEDDFFDRVHLSASGGAVLSGLVALALKNMEFQRGAHE